MRHEYSLLREVWKNALCRSCRFSVTKVWKLLHSENLFLIMWSWTYSHKKWKEVLCAVHTEFSQWLTTKFLGTGVSVIVMYWGRVSVQWSSNPHFHLCGIMVTGLWYKTCKMNIAVTSLEEGKSQSSVHILGLFYIDGILGERDFFFLWEKY